MRIASSALARLGKLTAEPTAAPPGKVPRIVGGVPSGLTNKQLVDFEKDSAILALTQAGLDADVPAMMAALPAGSRAYERHVTGLDQWIAVIRC